MRNQIQLIGNIGKAPQIVAKTKDQRPVVSFAVAQDVNGMDAATQKLVKKEAQWFQISCFSSVAERALSLMKGDLVLISGELKSRSYLTDGGEKRTSVEVVAHEILRVSRLKKLGSTDGTSIDTTELGSDFENFEEEGSFA